MTTLLARDLTDVMNTPSSEQRSFRDRIGGRWALSVRGYILSFIVLNIGIGTEVVRMGSRDGTLFYLTTVLVYGLNGIIDLVLHRTRWSQRRVKPVPTSEVLTRWAFAGISMSSSYAVLNLYFDVETPLSIASGFLLYPTIAVWLASSLIMYLDVVDQARLLRRQLVDERARSIEILGRAKDAMTQLRHRVGNEVNPGLHRLRKATQSIESASISEEIRTVVDESVRGVGHALWDNTRSESIRIGFGEIVRSLIVHPVFRPWPMIGFAILVPLFSLGRDINGQVLMLSSVAAVATYVECSIANSMMVKWVRFRLVVVVLFISVLTGQTLLADRLGEEWGQSGDDPGVIALIFLTVCLVVVTSALGSFRDLNDQRAQAIAAEISEEQLDAAAQAQAVSDETRRLAALLHGRVQSRLLGCAMAIEFAGNDSQSLKNALDRTLEVLHDDWLEIARGEVNALDDVVKTWSGLALIDLHIGDDVREFINDDVSVVVEELIANAIRHGRAQSVVVNLARDDLVCRITVSDDGLGGDETRVGLGSLVIENVGAVERIRTQDGWTVAVEIPIST